MENLVSFFILLLLKVHDVAKVLALLYFRSLEISHFSVVVNLSVGDVVGTQKILKGIVSERKIIEKRIVGRNKIILLLKTQELILYGILVLPYCPVLVDLVIKKLESTQEVFTKKQNQLIN